MSKFNVGDRVMRISNTREGNVPIGALGTVLGWFFQYDYEEDYIKVRWDEVPRLGHSCGGLCEDGRGWNVPARDLECILPDAIDENDFDASDIVSMLDSFLTSE